MLLVGGFAVLSKLITEEKEEFFNHGVIVEVIKPDAFSTTMPTKITTVGETTSHILITTASPMVSC